MPAKDVIQGAQAWIDAHLHALCIDCQRTSVWVRNNRRCREDFTRGIPIERWRESPRIDRTASGISMESSRSSYYLGMPIITSLDSAVAVHD